MTRFRSSAILLILLIINSISNASAQNWPCWRGPDGDGTSTETNLPVKWDSVTNVIWKVSVPGTGYSSPVIWGDRLFLTTAMVNTQEKVLICYNKNNGEIMWKKTMLKGPLEKKHDDNSYASGTPSTDGNLIYVSFLDGENVTVAAYDFSGKQVWLTKPGTFSSPHGYSCSPVLFEDKVIINGDNLGDSFIAALNKSDGKVVWKVKHENPAHSFSTPIFRKIGGKTQMVFCGNKEIAGYNPADGRKIWFVSGPSEDFTATPVYNKKSGLVLMSSAWPVRTLVAIKPDGQGDVTKSHVVWQTRKGAYYVPSPVCTDDYLYSTMTTGEVYCTEVATGKVMWVNKLGLQYSSPVLAGGLIYMPNDEGVITVIKSGQKFEAVARNPMGEKMNASPAISNGRFYIRGYRHLFCIGK